MSFYRLWKFKPVFVTLFFLPFSYPAFAAMVLLVDLDEMITRADRIFVGTCLSVRQGLISVGGGTLPMTMYTFEVSEPLKGLPPGQVTFKQVGLSSAQVHVLPEAAPGRTFQSPLHILGMPEYRPGDEVLLFLTAESSAGLTAPVGLFQGAFFARKDALSGKKFLSNGIQNAGLVPGRYGPFLFEDLLAQIRSRLRK